jgi:hypothetical protein
MLRWGSLSDDRAVMCRESVAQVLVPTNERRMIVPWQNLRPRMNSYQPLSGESEFGALRSLIAVSDDVARRRADFVFEE